MMVMSLPGAFAVTELRSALFKKVASHTCPGLFETVTGTCARNDMGIMANALWELQFTIG